jgi:hypothetical protein
VEFGNTIKGRDITHMGKQAFALLCYATAIKRSDVQSPNKEPPAILMKQSAAFAFIDA